MTSQLDRWTGDFGREYTDRNQVDWRTRVDGFKQMIPSDVSKVLDVGCNAGHNIRALLRALPEAMVVGTEPAAYARSFAYDVVRKDKTLVGIYEYSIYELWRIVNIWMRFDLALTSGVLIHVPLERLDEALAQMFFASQRYILAIEYAGDDEAVPYRGYDDMLWKRDYGQHYQRLFPELKLVATGENVPGFEGATYWLLKK